MFLRENKNCMERTTKFVYNRKAVNYPQFQSKNSAAGEGEMPAADLWGDMIT